MPAVETRQMASTNGRREYFAEALAAAGAAATFLGAMPNLTADIPCGKILGCPAAIAG